MPCPCVWPKYEIKMFWKKTNPKEKLQKKYESLMKEAFELSKTNRTEADKKYAEADAVAKEIEGLG